MPDAVVVGSGAGGAAMAWRLARGGLSVLVLEAGPRFDPARDYPQTEPDWERRGFPTPPGSRQRVVLGELGSLAPEHAELASFTAVAGRLARGDRRMAMGPGWLHVQGVGGTTLHFVGEAHRLAPHDFRLRSLQGKGADWPIGYQTLAPWYLEAERLLGVAGPRTDAFIPREAPFPQPAHRLSTAARVLAAAGRRRGQHWQANARAVLSRPMGDRPACNYCTRCAQGCPLGDKGSADVTWLRAAEATGRVKILERAQVTRIIPARGGRVGAVTCLHEGRLKRIETPILVLAAGAVGTPRLLLASADAAHPDGLANGSGEVGRNFMETLWLAMSAFVPGLRDSHKGLPADAHSRSLAGPGAVPGAAGGFILSSAVREMGLTGPLAYVRRLLPGHGTELKEQLRARFGSAVTVLAVGETISDERSRVSLDPLRRDAAGVPLARIDTVLADNSLTLLHAMARESRALLDAAGAEETRELYTAWDLFSATHVFGTCRMGDDPRRSVVRADGRSHELDNLWIADASVFPSSGSGAAPSLTISALALRTAEAIIAGR